MCLFVLWPLNNIEWNKCELAFLATQFVSVNNIKIIRVVTFFKEHVTILTNYQQFFIYIYILILFSVWLLSVLRGHSFFHPRHNGQWPPTSKDFLSQILLITFFSYFNSSERASIFPFQCSVLNKGTTGTIVITSLVWRGPWLGIEPGTSRTRCQHSTTRLSRRRYYQQ